MGTKYEHIEDGTPFTSEELNSRVESVTDTLNNLSRQELALGALRTEHVPTPLGLSDDEDGTVRTSLGGYAYGKVDRVRLGEVNNTRVTFITPIDFSESDVDALIVLANIQVVRFVRPDGTYVTQPGVSSGEPHYAFEDGWRAIFKIVVVTTDGEEHIVSWSNRATSPGLTVSGIPEKLGAYPKYAGSVGYSAAMDDDDDSFKDVAIRTVIKEGDFTLPIKAVYLKVRTWAYPATEDPDHAREIFVHLGKRNLTALPIQCRLEA